MTRGLLIFSVMLVAIFYSCTSGDAVAKEAPANVATDSANFTTVKWNDTAVDFGTVKRGEKVHIKYTCTNTGNKPLFIYYVRPGCGCTVADYTKAAIAPGKTGMVDAEFDSNHGAPGQVHKTIMVQTNTTNASPKLSFSGVVKVTEEAAKKSS